MIGRPISSKIKRVYSGISGFRSDVSGGTPTPTDPTTPNFGLWSPLTIASEVGATEYPMVLSALFPPEAQTTDYVRLQVRSLPALTEVLNVRVLVGSGSQTFPGLSSILTGSHTLRERLERGIYYGDWSNSLEHGPDVIVPVLTSPTASSAGTTTASIGVTTDTAEGTLYYVLTTSATPPSKAQVKAGQNNGGTSAAWAGSQAVTTAGAKAASPSSLTAATTYYAYFMHEDVAGNQSTVAAASSFATDAATAVTFHAVHAFDTQNIAYANVVATFTGGSIGTAQSNRVVVACLTEYDGSNTAPSSVTIGGVAATLVDHSAHMSMWRAAVPTGTTATVVATYGFNIDKCGCTIVSIRTGSPVPASVVKEAWQWGGSGPAAAVTVPANGMTVAFAARDSTGAVASWSNATARSFKDNLMWSVGTATRDTAGSATITAGGFTGVDRGLLTATWGP